MSAAWCVLDMLWLHFVFSNECPGRKGLGQEIEEVVRKLGLVWSDVGVRKEGLGLPKLRGTCIKDHSSK